MEHNILKQEVVEGLKVTKIFNSEHAETLLITLSKNKMFPKHNSPKDALLVVLEGEINFFITNKTIKLCPLDTFSFAKEVDHYVIANTNAKFLIIR